MTIQEVSGEPSPQLKLLLLFLKEKRQKPLPPPRRPQQRSFSDGDANMQWLILMAGIPTSLVQTEIVLLTASAIATRPLQPEPRHFLLRGKYLVCLLVFEFTQMTLCSFKIQIIRPSKYSDADTR
jgi:hypothetical protein